jgi:uncharacterized protein (TIGR02996 family)
MLEEAFWRSIQEAPDDDAPRLIYADWLEEQGDPALAARAEFIRVQCELARLPEDAKDRRADLENREAVLWKKHGKAWGAPLRPFSRKFSFRRGFPDQVLVQGKTFLENAEKVLSAAPIFSIRLRNSKEQISALAQCPALGRLISLSLYWNHIGLKRAQVFFASPHLSRLSDLDLDDNDIRVGGVRALAEAKLPRLKTLNLRANKIENAGLESLAGAPLLGQLHTLGLVHNDLGDAGVAALAASPHAEGLVSLDLGYNPAIGDSGVYALACSPHLSRLRNLGLGAESAYQVQGRSTGVTEIGARALASSVSLAGLTSLDLGGQSLLGDAGVCALVESTNLTRLTTLRLWGCGIGARGVAALASSAWLAGLTHLDLADNPWTDEAAEALARSPHLTRLRYLRVAMVGRRGPWPKAKKTLLARFGEDVCVFR